MRATSGASAVRRSPRPAPFSDYTGFDRLQVLVAGSGLVLQTPSGEIDVRRPFRPVRFAGETPIVSRLEAGPVEVINLMGERRQRAHSILLSSKPASSSASGPGMHIAYCPGASASCGLPASTHELAGRSRPQDRGHRRHRGLRAPDVIVLGSVSCVSR